MVTARLPWRLSVSVTGLGRSYGGRGRVAASASRRTAGPDASSRRTRCASRMGGDQRRRCPGRRPHQGVGPDGCVLGGQRDAAVAAAACPWPARSAAEQPSPPVPAPWSPALQIRRRPARSTRPGRRPVSAMGDGHASTVRWVARQAAIEASSCAGTGTPCATASVNCTWALPASSRTTASTDVVVRRGWRPCRSAGAAVAAGVVGRWSGPAPCAARRDGPGGRHAAA